MNEKSVCSNFTQHKFKPDRCNECFHLISEHLNISKSNIEQTNPQQHNIGTKKNGDRKYYR